MATERAASVMQRKLARVVQEGTAGSRAALPALRLACARGAAAVMDLALAVIGANQRRCSAAGLRDLVPENQLMVFLDGPEGLCGGAILDSRFVTGVIQKQTMGTLLEAPETDEPRYFTDTDAALSAPLLDEILERAAVLAEIPEDQRLLEGFRFGARAVDVRTLLVAMEADHYRVFDLALDLGAGISKGQMMLILPDLPLSVADDPPEEETQQSSNLGNTMLQVPAELTVVLSRERMSLGQLAALREGDRIELMPRRFDRIELAGPTGEPVAYCHLGQSSGLRAIRVNETVSDAGSAGPAAPVHPTEPPQQSDSFAPHQVPTVSEPPPPEMTDEPVDLDLSALSPEDAAREITQLAGLPDAEMTAETETPG